MPEVPKGGRPTGVWTDGAGRDPPGWWVAIQHRAAASHLDCGTEVSRTCQITKIHASIDSGGDYGDLIVRPPSVTPGIPCPWGE